MSDTDSPTNYQPENQEGSRKRRRLDESYDHASRYSSPDELAASSDLEESHVRRASRVIPRDSHDRQQRSFDDSDAEDSPDELAIHTLYRDGRVRSRRQSTEESVHEDTNGAGNVRSPSPVRKRPTVRYKPGIVLKAHKKGVAAVKISPDGQLIASCSADATVRIWDTVFGALKHTLRGHLAGISTIAWSPDSKTLASGSDDKSIRLWNVATGKPYPIPLLGHHNYIYSIAFSPKGNMLVSGSYDEAVFLWDVRTARVMRSLPAHSDPVGGVDFIRDGTLVVSCSGDGLIRVWDTSTGQCLRTLVHEDNAPVVSVRFSPNGKFILAWTLDSCVRLWNYVEGRCVKTYQGHMNQKYSIGGAFGVYGDEAVVASGSEDGGIFIWDVTSKRVLQKLDGHEGVVLSVDTHPKEDLLVSGGLDRTVRIWRIDRNEHDEDDMES